MLLLSVRSEVWEDFMVVSNCNSVLGWQALFSRQQCSPLSGIRGGSWKLEASQQFHRPFLLLIWTIYSVTIWSVVNSGRLQTRTGFLISVCLSPYVHLLHTPRGVSHVRDTSQ